MRTVVGVCMIVLSGILGWFSFSGEVRTGLECQPVDLGSVNEAVHSGDFQNANTEAKIAYLWRRK